MFRNTMRIDRKAFIIFFATFLVTAGITLSTLAEGKETGGIKGIIKAKKVKYVKHCVVYIDTVPNNFEPPQDHVVMDQKNMTFIPHVLPVIKGTTVDFLNSDEVQHNIYSPDAVADHMNLGTWLKGEKRSFTFNTLGIATILCNVHSDMLAYILVLQNPYFAVVNKDGSFALSNIPEGKYVLKLWNPRAKKSFWGKQIKAEDQQIEIHAGSVTTVTFQLQ
ncbi:MAG: hypothetical protein MRJ65_03865 [Candidatus Brocadiaceae bacterium]|nr:hypothetical protein [Candidatus Brocadiaceae bacterium]